MRGLLVSLTPRRTHRGHEHSIRRLLLVLITVITALMVLVLQFQACARVRLCTCMCACACVRTHVRQAAQLQTGILLPVCDGKPVSCTGNGDATRQEAAPKQAVQGGSTLIMVMPGAMSPVGSCIAKHSAVSVRSLNCCAACRLAMLAGACSEAAARKVVRRSQLQEWSRNGWLLRSLRVSRARPGLRVSEWQQGKGWCVLEKQSKGWCVPSTGVRNNGMVRGGRATEVLTHNNTKSNINDSNMGAQGWPTAHLDCPLAGSAVRGAIVCYGPAPEHLQMQGGGVQRRVSRGAVAPPASKPSSSLSLPPLFCTHVVG